MKITKEKKPLTDEHTEELIACVMFALNNLHTRSGMGLVMHTEGDSYSTETFESWFSRALKPYGYDVDLEMLFYNRRTENPSAGGGIESWQATCRMSGAKSRRTQNHSVDHSAISPACDHGHALTEPSRRIVHRNLMLRANNVSLAKLHLANNPLRPAVRYFRRWVHLAARTTSDLSVIASSFQLSGRLTFPQSRRATLFQSGGSRYGSRRAAAVLCSGEIENSDQCDAKAVGVKSQP